MCNVNAKLCCFKPRNFVSCQLIDWLTTQYLVIDNAWRDLYSLQLNNTPFECSFTLYFTKRIQLFRLALEKKIKTRDKAILQIACLDESIYSCWHWNEMLLSFINWKTKIYHTVRTVPSSIRKIIETGESHINTHM
jgi:hypothetical protein